MSAIYPYSKQKSHFAQCGWPAIIGRMAKTIYPYIEDEILLKEVEKVFNTMKKKLSEIEKGFHGNVVDPFSAYFDATYQDINHTEWIEQEKSRQLQKSLQNTIGYFHQRLLGAVSDWNDPGAGAGHDSENKRKKIFAEIKNKHNTLNGASGKETYDKMTAFLDGSKKGYMGYVVQIIPKKPKRFSKHFAPSSKKGKTAKRDDLLCVDGATYYEIVTGDKQGLKKLFQALPIAIARIRKSKMGKEELKRENKLFSDLFERAFENS